MKKFITLTASIYYDIFIHVIFLITFLYSLISNTYNIFPIDDVLKPFIGVNNLKEFIQAMHIILICFSLIFLAQTILIFFGLAKGYIKKRLAATILYYKWLITSFASAVPFIYNHPISPLYVVANIFLLFLFWYKATEYNI
tara:strand:+ start:354 stop:776 length:423 start_codon:yes stop_codon:yes gene_type:complete